MVMINKEALGQKIKIFVQENKTSSLKKDPMENFEKQIQ
jgi:hypothetical protein